MESFCGYWARGVSVQKICFIEKAGLQDWGLWGGGGRQVEQRSSDLRVAYAEVKVQVRDLVRVVVIVDPLPQGCQFSGKIRFIEPQGVNGHRRPVPSAPSNCTPRESQTNFRGRTVWGL